MELLFALGLLTVLAIPLWLGLRRATELFSVEVRDGKTRLARGHCPPRLLSDLGDVARRGRLERATVRVVTEGGKPRVVPGAGLDDAVLQQLRNVVGTWSVQQIRAGRKRA